MILSVLKLMRVYYGGPLGGGFVVIMLYRSGLAGFDAGLAGMCFLSLFCIISAGYVFNDACDVAVDRINCPGREVAAGRISYGRAKVWAGILAGAGLVSGLFCGAGFFIGAGIISAGLVFYDVFSKRLGVFKDIAAAVLVTGLYPLAFTVGEGGASRQAVLFIHPVWLFLTTFGYEVFKDVRDRAGDMQVNQGKTAAVKFLGAARVAVLAGAAVTFLPFVLGYCGYVYLGGIVAATLLGLGAAVSKPERAIRFIYAQVVVVTAVSLADYLVYGV